MERVAFICHHGFERSDLLLLLLFPHISPISRTRGHRRRLPFPYHRYIQKTQTKEEKERKKITDEKTSPDLIGGEGKK